jgi:catechol 2,3-dioxygenase-like lactoylglutathione lyase family enzyme
MAVTNLQHFALAVPDPAIGRDFYQAAGLDAIERGSGIAMRCAGRDQDQILLVEGPRRRLHHISFGTTAAGLDAVRRAAEALGAARRDPPNETPLAGLWLEDPDGILVNVRIAEAAPSRGGPDALGGQQRWVINSPGHYDRRAARGALERDAEVLPRRLGHVLQFTPDPVAKKDFYTRVLGMKLADHVGDALAWFYCDGGSDHHVVAFGKSDGPGFHHASFEMAGIDHIGVGARRLLDKGYRDGWGLGRHVIGSNYFHYVRDPWNGLIEFFSDIDYIPEGSAWLPKDWPEQDSLYLWGPGVPDDFIVNYETAH